MKKKVFWISAAAFIVAVISILSIAFVRMVTPFHVEDNRVYHLFHQKIDSSLVYTGTEQLKISKLYHVVNDVDAVIQTDYFTKDGVEYGYNESGKLVSVDMKQEDTAETSGEVTEERMLQSLRAQLNEWIPDAEDYEVALFMKSIGGYQAMMENEANDIIAAYFDGTGKLSRVIIEYKNTFMPSVEQQAHYEAELEKYLSEKAGTYSSFSVETKYRTVQDKNFAIYTISFDKEGGGSWAEEIAVG